MPVSGARRRQNDPLQAARDLYESAAYEEALSELTRVKSSVTAPDAAREADRTARSVSSRWDGRPKPKSWPSRSCAKIR